MKYGWKGAAILLVLYAISAGFLIDVPALPILHETIRNLFFHVTMWFVMLILLTISLIYSIRYLGSFRPKEDLVTCEAARTGVFFGTLGVLTGMVWADFTWGAWWVNDPKLNGAAITLLAYLAYFILRGSLDDADKRARTAAVYNIFAFTLMLVFLIILPRRTDSLHPGSGGNPGFNVYDVDETMRWVFYPAVAGWALLSVWMLQLRLRMRRIEEKMRTLKEN